MNQPTISRQRRYRNRKNENRKNRINTCLRKTHEIHLDFGVKAYIVLEHGGKLYQYNSERCSSCWPPNAKNIVSFLNLNVLYIYQAPLGQRICLPRYQNH
jgi:hypothetical protein